MKRKASNPKGASKKKSRKTYTGAAAGAAFRRDFASGYHHVAASRRIGEVKGLDTDLEQVLGVVATTNTNANAVVLNLIQAGTGSWNRVGRKVNLKSVRLVGVARTTVTPAVTTGSNVANFVRMVVVWDKQPSGGAIPAFDNIFGITAQDGTESCPDILCPPKYDNQDRYRVMRDKVMEMTPAAFAATGTVPSAGLLCTFDEYIKLNNAEVVFQGQSSPMTIADVSSGALYVYFRSYNNQAAVAQAQIDAIARLRYID